jgi:predicted lactoylglutathione lyase
MGAVARGKRRFTIVTLGARNLDVLRSFYGAWGWSETETSTTNWVAYEMGPTKVALWPIEMLRAEAAPERAVAPSDVWNGITLAVNVESKEAVHALCELAVAAGGTAVVEPAERDWGGYSGYIADPEGNHWEVAWASDVTF